MRQFNDNSFSLLRQEIFQNSDTPRQFYSPYFQNWCDNFSQIYDMQVVVADLYVKHATLVILTKWILESYQLQPDFSCIKNMFGWIATDGKILEKLRNPKVQDSPPNYSEIESIYPELVSPQTRHALGEVYTPPELANLLIARVLETKEYDGLKILDPACGSGTFLLSFLNILCHSPRSSEKSISSFLENVTGFDINPLAVFTCKASIQLFCARNKIPQPRMLKIFVADPLFGSINSHEPIQSDIILGNPPWYNLGAVHNREYQEKLKILARQLGIYPANSANIPNIEIAALFLYRLARDFLAPRGLIALLMPRNILKGSQNARTRYFHNLKNIEIWDFGQTSFFPVEFIALFGREAYGIAKSTNLDFCVKYWRVKSQAINNTGWNFRLGKSQIYWPVNVDLKKSNIGRLVSEKIRNQIPPLDGSPYAQKFHNGARLGPRSFLFVLPGCIKGEEIEICPDPEGVKTSRGRWKHAPFDIATVHQSNIFQCVMSKFLSPFFISGTKSLFLPLNPTLDFNLKSLDPHSFEHFATLSREYQKMKKTHARQETLWDYIAYNGKTTNPLQMRPLKVIYNSIGRKRVKAAVLHEPILVDDSLYFCSPDSEAEAYYLAAILNSDLVNFTVINIKDERNIHKNPWRIPIPIWENSALHRAISEIGRSMEQKIKARALPIFAEIPKKELESQILEWTRPELMQLDVLLKKIIHARH